MLSLDNAESLTSVSVNKLLYMNDLLIYARLPLCCCPRYHADR